MYITSLLSVVDFEANVLLIENEKSNALPLNVQVCCINASFCKRYKCNRYVTFKVGPQVYHRIC